MTVLFVGLSAWGLRVGNWTHAIEIRDRVIGRGRKGEIDIRELGRKRSEV